MAKSTIDSLQTPFETPRNSMRRCDRPGCDEEGRFPAPKSRDRLNSRYWFCLEHIRAYNQAWDYFKGMSEAEIESQRRDDAVWQRPSWPMGGARNGRLHDEAVHDPFGFFSQDAKERPRSPQDSEREKALALFNLGPDTTFEEIRARYKTLAKKLHPDANGGDIEAEERLKSVNQAYSLLKSRFSQ
jgi:hypothetical protein